MHDISHTQILSSQSSWNKKFQIEKEKLRDVFGIAAIGIEHIGSSSVDGLPSKPIIDIAILIEKRDDADKFVDAVERLGYWHDKPNSSGERHFFRKGKPTEFHLSIAYADRGNFWERQILFRDYIKSHIEARDEYAQLKTKLLKKYPTGSDGYISGKSKFIQRILDLAKKEEK